MNSKPPLSSMSPFLNFVHEEVHARPRGAVVRGHARASGRGSVVQDEAEEGALHFEAAVVLDEP